MIALTFLALGIGLGFLIATRATGAVLDSMADHLEQLQHQSTELDAAPEEVKP